jgi:hypothetical protein
MRVRYKYPMQKNPYNYCRYFILKEGKYTSSLLSMPYALGVSPTEYGKGEQGNLTHAET